MNFFLVILSAVLLILSFPNFEISYFAWFALIPLFFVIKRSSPVKSFIFSSLAGVIFFAGTLYWLAYVTKLGYFVLALFLSLFFALFGLFAGIFLKRPGDSRLSFLSCLIIPSLWVALEFIRGILFTGFPWCILGYSQYKNPLIIQIADITGAYGVSFLIVMFNFVLFSFLSTAGKKHESSLLFQSIALCVVLIFSVGYGYFSLKKERGSPSLKLAVAQGGIEQFKKWDPAYKDYILNTYEMLTEEMAQKRPDLLIWPETAIPSFIDEYDIQTRLKNLVRKAGIPLFSGAVTYKYEGGRDYFFNSAVLFFPDGAVKGQYDKIHLVPFGEYIPLEANIPFFRGSINKEIGNYTKGEEFTIFTIEKDGKSYKYAALICFEDIFPELARRFTASGADFLINVTNDAWFMESSEQRQHAQASVFRAVENRRSIIRAANNGLSCYIDPKGEIRDYIGKDSQDIYKKGQKAFRVEISRRKSFYSTHGDIFSYACFIFLIASYLVDFYRPRI